MTVEKSLMDASKQLSELENRFADAEHRQPAEQYQLLQSIRQSTQRLLAGVSKEENPDLYSSIEEFLMRVQGKLACLKPEVKPAVAQQNYEWNKEMFQEAYAGLEIEYDGHKLVFGIPELIKIIFDLVEHHSQTLGDNPEDKAFKKSILENLGENDIVLGAPFVSWLTVAENIKQKDRNRSQKDKEPKRSFGFMLGGRRLTVSSPGVRYVHDQGSENAYAQENKEDREGKKGEKPVEKIHVLGFLDERFESADQVPKEHSGFVASDALKEVSYRHLLLKILEHPIVKHNRVLDEIKKCVPDYERNPNNREWNTLLEQSKTPISDDEITECVRHILLGAEPVRNEINDEVSAEAFKIVTEINAVYEKQENRVIDPKEAGDAIRSLLLKAPLYRYKQLGSSSRLTEDMPSSLPILVFTLFIAEFSRNRSSFTVGKMLLDLIETRAHLKCGNIPVTWRNALCYPKMLLSGKSADVDPGRVFDQIGGLHPMAHGGSYDPDFIDGPYSMDERNLSWAHVKTGVIICEWLSRYLKAHGVNCTILSRSDYVVTPQMKMVLIQIPSVSLIYKEKRQQAKAFLASVFDLLQDPAHSLVLPVDHPHIPLLTLIGMTIGRSAGGGEIAIPPVSLAEMYDFEAEQKRQQITRLLEEKLNQYDRNLSVPSDDRDKAGIYYRMGTVSYDLAKVEQALKYFNQSLAVLPRAGTHLKCGELLYKMQRYQEAIGSYTACLQMRPNDPVALHHRGNAFYNLGKIYHATSNYLATMSAYESALENYNLALKSIELDINTRAIFLEDRGRLFFKLADIGCFFVQTATGQRYLTHESCVVALNGQQFIRRQSIVNRSIDMVPLIGTEIFLSEEELYEAALTDFENATTLWMSQALGYARTLNRQGIILAMLHRHEEAAQKFAESLKARPKDAETLHNYGLALSRVNPPRLTEALVSFERALKIEPNNIDTLYYHGSVLRDLNQLPRALASFESVLKIKPNDSDALVEREKILALLDSQEMNAPQSPHHVSEAAATPAKTVEHLEQKEERDDPITSVRSPQHAEKPKAPVGFNAFFSPSPSIPIQELFQKISSLLAEKKYTEAKSQCEQFFNSPNYKNDRRNHTNLRDFYLLLGEANFGASLLGEVRLLYAANNCFLIAMNHDKAIVNEGGASDARCQKWRDKCVKEIENLLPAKESGGRLRRVSTM